MVPASPIRVLIADDEPALRGALADLFAHEDSLVLVGEAGDADQAIELADARRPDVAIVDVSMPAGGGPRAAREIIRVSPSTRVIALSAFEDRPTVLEMLRAGAVGYLVKGTASQDLLGSITKVFDGGASLSAELIDGVVHELSSQLRREEIQYQHLAAQRGEIDRFLSGSGVTMVYQPIVNLRTREIVGMEALARFHSLPLRPPNEWFAAAVELELGVQLEMMAIRSAMAGLPLAARRRRTSRSTARRAPRCRPSSPRSSTATRRGWSSRSPSTRRSRTTRCSRPRSKDCAHTVCGWRSTTRVRGSRACGTRCLLRPDIVKVDTSLTRDIDGDRAKRALTSALVSFGEEMGIAIVAEGIETREELDDAGGAGCAVRPGLLPGRTRSAVTDQVVRRSIAHDDPAVAFVYAFISVAMATASA